MCNLKLTKVNFDFQLRTIGKNRGKYGQDSRRHDGRRKGFKWNGEMLWYMRFTVEKVGCLFHYFLELKLS